MYSIANGDRCRQGKPLEHTAGPPSPALVEQLKVLGLTWPARVLALVKSWPEFAIQTESQGYPEVVPVLKSRLKR